MHCTHCGNSLNEGDKFCASCGTAVGTPETPINPAATPHAPRQKNRHRRHSQHHQTEQASGAPAEQRRSHGRNEAGAARFNELIAEKAARKRKILWPISGAILLWTLFELGFLDGFFYVVVAFILFLIGLARPTLSHSQYTSIPGTATNRDKPRCVHCGHIGIYVHGKYKTNTTYHDCSSCGRNLYTS